MYKICSQRECSQLIKTESCRIWLLSWLSWDAWSLQDRSAGGKDQCLGLRSSLGAWFCSSPHTPGIPWPPLDIVANPASLPCRTVLCSEDLHSQISSVFCLKGRPLHHLRLAALFCYDVTFFWITKPCLVEKLSPISSANTIKRASDTAFFQNI